MNTKTVMHTPMPWKVMTMGKNKTPYIADDTGDPVADVDMASRIGEPGTPLANAAFIVKAVNCHEELLGVAHAFVEHLQNCGDKPTPELLKAIAKAEGK
jgi:hypothetical protein